MDSTLTQPALIAPGKTREAPGVWAQDFDSVVREHQRRVFRVLLSLLRDADAAATLTQECFLRAYQKRESYRGESSLGTWLVRIAVNLATDHRRNRRRAFWSRLVGRDASSETPAIEIADTRATQERALLVQEQVAAVWRAADMLSSRQRAIFVLRFAEDMSIEEIAQVTDLETGTVKSHLHRGLSAVRRRLKEWSQA